MKAIDGFFFVAVVLLTTPVSQSMRVEVRNIVEELGEEREYISSRDKAGRDGEGGRAAEALQVSVEERHEEKRSEGEMNEVKQVKPGLGWGTLPLADFYTTPLCIDPATGEVSVWLAPLSGKL